MPSAAPSQILAPGTPAPDFTLPYAPGKPMTLSRSLDKLIVLIFYPADWSPVCGDQLGLYNEILDEFQRYDAQLIGISVDGVWCHAQYAKERQFGFKLLADFEPKGAVARQFGAYRAADGLCERAIFVIDTKGIIRWSYLSPIDQNPGADGILAALDDLAASPKISVSTTAQSQRAKPAPEATHG